MPDMARYEKATSLDTIYQVSGFRSLINFVINLRPGINVLVGPNGSGKTNYIDFLDFLDWVIRFGASAAVSNAGGVARVFSSENSKGSTPSLSTRIHSIAEVINPNSYESAGFFKFIYDLEIQFSKKNSSIFLSKEAIKIGRLCNSELIAASTANFGSISITRRSPREDCPPKSSISRRLLTQNERNPFKIAPRFREDTYPTDNLTGFELNLAPDESILSIRSRSMFPAFDAVRHALTRGRSFNIIPEKAREPDDITRPPLIQRDGAGLSTSLHFLRDIKKKGVAARSILSRRIDPQSFDMVLEWTRLIFPELNDISITQDPHTGKFLIYLLIGSNPSLKIPISAASDGTVKWLAFLTLIVSHGNAASIEEPENFLHPKMQQCLVDILRDSMKDKKSFFIISTHSETLINQCRPDEIILFEFNQFSKHTQCRRIEEPESIIREINQTGFGLGYYYASDALP